MIRTIEINTIILTKSTALASTIGVIELTYTAQRFVTSNSGNSFEIFGLAAIAYIIILSAILQLFQLLISAFNKTKISGAS